MALKITIAAGVVAAALAGAASAQAPAPAAPAASKAPADYRTVMATAEVAKPVAEVMAKTGKFCDIAVWIKAPCVVNAGKDGELGANRLIANRINEILVAKTSNSYTYAQPLAPNSYHGTVEYLPAMGGKGTKIVYTLFWDISVNPDHAAKDKDAATRDATVKRFVAAIKAQAEG